MTGYAKVVADSISPEGVRLTTMEVKFHRFVLAEFNTHRVFSRNSASSRAIPAKKQIQRVREDVAYPVEWPAEQRGMQGGDSLPDSLVATIRDLWWQSALKAVFMAEDLGPGDEYASGAGLHKSVVNRLLEPYMWHTVVVTSTAWGNFFAQRCNPLAQPEIRVAAEQMREAMRSSEPLHLREGDWHCPYVTVDDEDVFEWMGTHSTIDKRLAPISAARCARVSYLTQDGVRDHQADLALYERLTSASPPHWSPLEHVATPWSGNRQKEGPWMEMGYQSVRLPVNHLPKVGNLLGWRSLRTEVEATRGVVTFR